MYVHKHKHKSTHTQRTYKHKDTTKIQEHTTSPTLITVEIISIMVTNFFWLLLVFQDDCKKRKFSENRGRGGPGPPKGVVEKN